jgi:hypothetical protein
MLMKRLDSLLVVVLSLCLLVVVWQWWQALTSRRQLLGQAGMLAASSLQDAADRLEEWSEHPSSQQMLIVRENWNHVRLIHDTFFRSEKTPPQWHHAVPFEAFLDRFSDPQQPVAAGDRCLAKRYVQALREWRSRAQLVALDPSPSAWTRYVLDYVTADIGALSIRESVCP